MNSATERIKVLIADDDNLMARRLAEYVTQKGFDARAVSNGKEAKLQIAQWKPRFVLADLMLPEGNALQLIDFIRTEKALRHQFIHVLVMSGHNTITNVQQALGKGAKDYIVKPFKPEELLRRLVFHSRAYKKLEEITNKDFNKVDEPSLMLHLTDLVMRQATQAAPLEDMLFNLTRMVSLKLDGVRCSVINCLDQRQGVVVTSNDDRHASGIRLELYNYPEVLHVLNTQTLVAIENLEESSELRHVRERVKDISFNSLIVSPVSRWAQPFGVLSLRLPPEKQTITDNEIRFVEIVSHVVSLVLSNEMHKEDKTFWLKDDPRGSAPIPLRKGKNS